MKVTTQNYYDNEINKAYFNNSQIKKGDVCLAWWRADRDNLWFRSGSTEALDHGTYIDLALTEDPIELTKWCMDNKSVVYNKGSVKAGKNYKILAIDEAIVRARNDKGFMSKLSGKKQVVLSFENFHGFPYRCRLDDLNLKEAELTDLKSCRDIDDVSFCKSLGRRAHWIEAFGYIQQLALYQDAVYKEYQVLCDCFIAALEKKKPFKRQVFKLTEDTPGKEGYDDISWKDVFSYYVEHAVDVMSRMTEYRDVPISEVPRCENCEYCWSTQNHTYEVPFLYDSRIIRGE